MTFDEFIRFAVESRANNNDSRKVVECPVCEKMITWGLLGHLEEDHGVPVHDRCACGAALVPNDALSNYDHYATFPSPAEHIRECAVIAALGGLSAGEELPF